MATWRLINEIFQRVSFYFLWAAEQRAVVGKMENAPAVKANEANLEELNKRIIEIKRKIVLKGESLIIFHRPLAAPTKPNKNLMTCCSLSFHYQTFALFAHRQRVKRRPTSRIGWANWLLLFCISFANSLTEKCYRRTPTKSSSPTK